MTWKIEQLQRAAGYLEQNQLQAAQRTAQDLVKRDPKYADGWFFLSKLAQQVGQADSAQKLLHTALKLRPDDLRFHAHRLYLMAVGLQTRQVLAEIEQLQDKAGSDSFLWGELGNILHICGELKRAQQAFLEAEKLEPNNVDHQRNLATSFKFTGDFEKAEQYASRVLKAHPDDYELYGFRAGLRRQTNLANHTAELEHLLERGITDWRGEMQVAYAVGKEHEDLGNMPKAFKNYQRAGALRRSKMNYQVQSDVETIAGIIQTYDEEFLRPLGTDGFHSEEPVFIVGLPRTGTTLLERILSNHSEVYAAGELQNFSNQLTRLTIENSPGALGNKNSLVAAAPAIDHRELGKAYLESTRPRTGSTPRFIDKMPLNYLYVGAIARALPHARIIHMDRHPVDAAFAIYKTSFTQAYPFAYDLEDLGHYVVAYRKLMRHWHEHLGDRLIHVHYESLVEDTEGVSRGIFDAIGLSWQPECLEFHRNTAPTNTASAVQVRNKIYSSSVGKWREFEHEMEPFIKILKLAERQVE
ncbi:MAG: sulfotransferase [Pseudomonadales bacterium]